MLKTSVVLDITTIVMKRNDLKRKKNESFEKYR